LRQFFLGSFIRGLSLKALNRLAQICVRIGLLGMPFAGGASVLAATDVERRIESREFPSIFLAWSLADNLKQEDPISTFARHDLAIEGPEALRLRWNNSYRGLADDFQPSSLDAARDIRAKLLKLNPHTVLIAEVRYRDAPGSFLPESSAWWKRKDGVRAAGWAEGHYFLLDFANPEFRAQVARQARAVMATGVFDGIFLDWWKDDDDRLSLIRAIRDAVGEQAIILVNANDEPKPRTAPFVNGYYMECYRSDTAKDWGRIASTLQWAETTLRQPRVNCVETWFHKSRQDLNLMRATTTLTLTMSDGYCLFADPDALPTPDHLHDWYDFWEKTLGRPLAHGSLRADGSWERSFANGVAVYNPMGNAPTAVQFKSPHRQLSTGEIGMQFRVPACDGDIFLLLPENGSRNGR
jgi:hypothetical protein